MKIKLKNNFSSPFARSDECLKDAGHNIRMMMMRRKFIVFAFREWNI